MLVYQRGKNRSPNHQQFLRSQGPKVMSFSRWIPSTVWRPDGWFIYGIWRLFPCQVCRFEQKLTGHRKERLVSSIRLAPSVGWLCGIGCASSSSGDHRGGNWEEIPSDSMRFHEIPRFFFADLTIPWDGTSRLPRLAKTAEFSKEAKGQAGTSGSTPAGCQSSYPQFRGSKSLCCQDWFDDIWWL